MTYSHAEGAARGTDVESEIGICIPVRSDARGLGTTLRSLDTLPQRGRLVVSVGIDGSDASSESLARQFSATVTVLPNPRGSYAARAAAVDALPPSIQVVLFTDAGCEVSKEWVSAHVEALQRADLSGGAVEIPLSHSPRVAEFVDARRNLLQEHYVKRDGFAATCNLAIKRNVIDEIGFRTELESGGDRDFCYRARAAGHRLVYAPAAVVTHAPRRTWREVLVKARRQGRGIGAMSSSVRPATLGRPRFEATLGRRHPRGRGLKGVGWTLAVATLDFARQLILMRAAKGAGFRAVDTPLMARPR